ncbi:YbhB/YbcL family Raf kinase inhibitor-like protein [Candidatus Pacearchaeota archaeon]|nr:YbhB/YbcL family Raf kinase inhibitor-like protein [Candidatus Pacearchaeota archaeon]
MILTSVFEDGTRIPKKYTCEGEDISPPLQIVGVPDGTKSLALIVEDPDSPEGTWIHWLVWNIAPDTLKIEEEQLPYGAIQGVNGFRENKYGGPCPPNGVHKYFFKLYALDIDVNLSDTSGKKELEDIMNGHILAEARLSCIYSKET